MQCMLVNYNECKIRFGSAYQIEKALRDGRLFKMDKGVYSESGDESEIEVLQAKYPNVADIQAIDSSKYNCDQIALLFAKQLIKRLKAN